MRSLEFTGGANRTRICDLFDVNNLDADFKAVTEAT